MEAGGHLALDLVADGAGHGEDIESQGHDLIAVEGDLQLGVAQLCGGLDVHHAGDPADPGLDVGRRGVQLVQPVAVDLDLDGEAEAEVGGTFELEARHVREFETFA